MKTKNLFFLLVIFPFLAIAQNEEIRIFKNKIAAGGFYDGEWLKSFEISYSKILMHRNELVFSLDYIRDGTTNEFVGGTGFNYSFFKKDTRFNFMVGAFLEFNYYYYHYYFHYPVTNSVKALYYSYGPGLYLNLSPLYQILKRFSITLDIKTGETYQFRNDHEHYGIERETDYRNGWIIKGTVALKVAYTF